jgi:hypothetical protein
VRLLVSGISAQLFCSFVQGRGAISLPEVQGVPGRAAAETSVYVLRCMDAKCKVLSCGAVSFTRHFQLAAWQWTRAAELVSTALDTFPTDPLQKLSQADTRLQFTIVNSHFSGFFFGLRIESPSNVIRFVWSTTRSNNAIVIGGSPRYSVQSSKLTFVMIAVELRRFRPSITL